MFVSQTSLEKGSVVVEDGDNALEVEGTPDMVLEVVSDTSVEKDTVTLPELYWRAGIREYWLIDARGPLVRFEIMRRGPTKYVSVRKQGGWVPSQVFGKSFRLVRRERPGRVSKFTLEMR
jgi:Uma2 family endonuclease